MFANETMYMYTANFFPIKSMGKPCVAKGPCNVHVNLTGIAGKPQICAKIEGKYEIKFCREKHVNISKYTYEINGKCKFVISFSDIPHKYYKLFLTN